MVALAGVAWCYGPAAGAPLLASPHDETRPSFARGASAHPSTLLREARQTPGSVAIYPPSMADSMLQLISDRERWQGADTSISKVAGAFQNEDGVAAVVDVCKSAAAAQWNQGFFDFAERNGGVVGYGEIFDGTFLFMNRAAGYSYVFGEAGQFACAQSTSVGLDSELLGTGKVITFSWSPFKFETVGSKGGSGETCLSFGWDAGVPLGLAVELCFDGDDDIEGHSVQSRETQEMIAAMAQQEFDGARHRARRQAERDGGRTRRSETRAALEVLMKLANALIPASIGIELGVSWGALDDVLEFFSGGAAIFVPTVTLSWPEQKLVHCQPASACTEKTMMEGWGEGTPCLRGLNCNVCKRRKSCPWWSPGVCFCG